MSDKKISAKNLEEIKPDHWTFPEDNSPDTQAGYGAINLNALFKDAEDIIIWHDLITKSNSYAQKMGIPNWRVAQAWRDQLELRNIELAKKGKVSGIRGIIWRFSSMFMDKFQRFWYEGKLK